LIALETARVPAAVLPLVVQKGKRRELGRQARGDADDVRRKLDMLLENFLLLRRQLLLFEQRRRQAGFADVLEQAKQSEKMDLVALELQEAAEHHHVDRHLQRPRMRWHGGFPQGSHQQEGLRIAEHAFGQFLRYVVDRFAVERSAAFGERLHEIVQQAQRLQVEPGCAPESPY
jgi:hypothetical protein